MQAPSAVILASGRSGRLTRRSCGRATKEQRIGPPRTGRSLLPLIPSQQEWRGQTHRAHRVNAGDLSPGRAPLTEAGGVHGYHDHTQ